MQKIGTIAAGIMTTFLLLAGPAQAGWIFGAEACTGASSCGGTAISEDNDSYDYRVSAEGGSSSCDRNIGWVNLVVGGSSEMCTGGDANACGGRDNPCSAPKADQAIEGDLPAPAILKLQDRSEDGSILILLA